MILWFYRVESFFLIDKYYTVNETIIYVDRKTVCSFLQGLVRALSIGLKRSEAGIAFSLKIIIVIDDGKLSFRKT